MKLRVDYQEIKQAICKDVAYQLNVVSVDVRFVSITRGKGDNVWAEVEISPTKDDQ